MSGESESVAAAKSAARTALEGQLGADGDGLQGVRRIVGKLEDAARQGDVEAQNLAGALALEFEQDPKKARRWFEMSARIGNPVGQRSLGHLYAAGLGMKADIPKAVEFFREAVSGGDVIAKYDLAAANIKMEGAYCSFDETLSLLESAAEGGVVESAAKIGDLLAGVDRDSEALDWYIKAANAGHIGAMNAAACWFRDGTVGQPDPVQSVRWFLAMLNHGNGDGVHEAIEIARGMSVDQIREAARLAGRPGEGEALISMLGIRD